jgi:hypothetical protein
MVNHFLVELKLTIGESQKKTIRIMEAISSAAAGRGAILCEGFGELEFGAPFHDAYDLGGEMHYEVFTVKPIPLEDVEVISKYMRVNSVPFSEQLIAEMAYLEVLQASIDSKFLSDKPEDSEKIPQWVEAIPWKLDARDACQANIITLKAQLEEQDEEDGCGPR